MAIPTFTAAGTAAGSIGTLSVPWPTHQANDIGVLVMETTSVGTTLTTTSSEWTQFVNSPVTVGSPGTRLTAYWARANTTAMANVSVNDGGDHQLGQVLCYRGCITSGTPYEVSQNGSGT